MFCKGYRTEVMNHNGRSAKLLLEIGKVKPDVIVMDPDLYVKIDGIETSRMIRNLFGVQVMYV